MTETDRQTDAQFVVVVLQGDDISRMIWPDTWTAQAYAQGLRDQGVPAENIRVYRTQSVRATRATVAPSFEY